MKLRNWIDINKLNWFWLSQNPAAIHLIEANPNKIHWMFLSLNPAAIRLLKANLDKIDCVMLKLSTQFGLKINMY